MRGVVAFVVLAMPLAARGQDHFPIRMPSTTPMMPSELASFLGEVPAQAFVWEKYLGPDFTLYYGHARRPLSGSVSLYVGWAPDERTIPSSTKVAGKLGHYPVEWNRAADDGAVIQNVLVQLDDQRSRKVKIWVTAKRAEDVDRLVAIVDRLPIFTADNWSVRQP